MPPTEDLFKRWNCMLMVLNLLLTAQQTTSKRYWKSTLIELVRFDDINIYTYFIRVKFLMTTIVFLFCSLGVKLSTIANPLACFLGFCVLPRSMISIAIMTAVSVGSAIYILVIASYSPIPPVNTPTAAVFMVRNNTVPYWKKALIGIKLLLFSWGEN